MRNVIQRLMTALFLMASIASMGQTVRGRVVDAVTSSPLVGASVKVVGASSGTSTDADGRFSINVASTGQLDVSYIGYETKRVPVNNQTELLILLINSSSILSDVVISTGARASARTLTTTPLTGGCYFCQLILNLRVSLLLIKHYNTGCLHLILLIHR